MLENVVWFMLWAGLVLGVIYLTPNAVLAYRKRNHEPPTKKLPSVVCPVCAGKWSVWSGLIVNQKPNDPKYPSSSGTYTVRSQTRQCEECGYAERRVLG